MSKTSPLISGANNESDKPLMARDPAWNALMGGGGLPQGGDPGLAPINSLMPQGQQQVLPAVAPPMPVDPQQMPPPDPDHISLRVPVPKADFPEEHHKDLHDTVMGEAFDHPVAHRFVREMYKMGRKTHPDVDPRHLLETARDSYYAVKHGFLPPDHAVAGLGHMARQRQRAAEEKK